MSNKLRYFISTISFFVVYLVSRIFFLWLNFHFEKKYFDIILALSFFLFSIKKIFDIIIERKFKTKVLYYTTNHENLGFLKFLVPKKFYPANYSDGFLVAGIVANFSYAKIIDIIFAILIILNIIPFITSKKKLN